MSMIHAVVFVTALGAFPAFAAAPIQPTDNMIRDYVDHPWVAGGPLMQPPPATSPGCYLVKLTSDRTIEIIQAVPCP